MMMEYIYIFLLTHERVYHVWTRLSSLHTLYFQEQFTSTAEGLPQILGFKNEIGYYGSFVENKLLLIVCI